MSKIYGTPVVTPISPAIIGGGGSIPDNGLTEDEVQDMIDDALADLDTGSGSATVAGISITEATDGSVTMVNTLSDGSTETIVISADTDGNPSGLTYNGVAIPLTYTKETGVSE